MTVPNRGIAVRRVAVQQLPGNHLTLTGPRADVLAVVDQQRRAHLLQAASRPVALDSGEVTVTVRLKRRRRRAPLLCAVGGVLAAIVVALWLWWQWVVAAAILLLLGNLLIPALRRGTSRCATTVTVTVTHRHR